MNKILVGAFTGVLLSTSAALTVQAGGVSVDNRGIHVVSDDGNFAANIGGRVQFDGYVTKPDKGSVFNSGVDGSGTGENANGGTYFRRAELFLSGKVYNFNYLIIENFSSSTVSGGLFDAWISHRLGPGVLYVGQHRPWRSFDEMTSNADTLFLERNVLSANGIYGGRIYAQGLFYRVLRHHLLFSHDHLFLGASAYSLGNTVQDYSPTQGVGYNGRIAYAPVVKRHEWLHIGASFSSDHADNEHPLMAHYSVYYGKKGDTQSVVDERGDADGHDPTEQVVAGELAGAYGPFLLKAEYGVAKFSQSASPDQTVHAYSVEGSVFLTGETRPYDIHRASMRLPTPLHSYGAVELAAGYNHISNDSFQTGDVSNCHRAASAKYPHSKIDRCEVNSLTAAVNYYPNQNVRFTLEYIRGEAELGDVDVLRDQPYTVEGRVQLNW